MAAHTVPDLPDGPQSSNFGLFGGLARLELPHDDALDALLFSNCDHATTRENGCVWLSGDGGRSHTIFTSLHVTSLHTSLHC